MALGVLNNLSAIYAENNLNKTNSSLQTVLQQLSSGSRINSGADDAAGLSLVNGLQANQTALTQSATNATEGVGLLEVADGALSQVTSLLDRAITLATEASNGTLNSTQKAAANDEYESILAEINNIGSTTTYNQERVFSGNTVSIYTGDSSATGSSIDELHISTLSEASVGDTSGKMTYSTGQNNMFINLSTSAKNASVSDSFSGGNTGTTTISVKYLTGSGSATTAATATISVGAGTSYANTADGLIDAINASGLGLSATFTTAANAGTAAVSSALGNGTETGILITGNGVGAGTNVGVVGELTDAGGGTLSGTLTIGSNSISLGTANSTDTLAHLQTTINNGDYGVTASISGSVLTLTSTNSSLKVSGTSLSDASGSLTLSEVPASLSEMKTTAGTIGKLTLTGDTTANDTLTGSLNIVGANGLTTVVAVSAANNNDTVAKLAAYINNLGIGVTATSSSSGTTATLTFTSTTNDSLASVSIGAPFADTEPGNTTALFGLAANTVPTTYYSMGISGTVLDISTGGGTTTTVMTTDTDGATGTATTSYSDAAGVSLLGTSLLTTTDAEKALNTLNEAISDVAAMDGYIGAQINMLNSLSSVMTTQQENVTSAQNAIQATDYAAATSAMSKYEILSQTGIAALAQANSVQQEVTKLLQS